MYTENNFSKICDSLLSKTHKSEGEQTKQYKPIKTNLMAE